MRQIVQPAVRFARVLYSAYAEERETVVCFLDFQEIGLAPSIVNYPVVERRVVEQPVQSKCV